MTFLKKYWREILIAVLSIALFLSFQTCEKEGVDIKVTERDVVIPAVEGNFDKPDKVTELPSAGKDSVKVGKQYIYSTHPLDPKLKKEISEAKDSISILKLLIKTGQTRENITDFSNDKLELKVTTLTKGELLSVTADFKIKETTVKVTDTTKTITKPSKLSDIVSKKQTLLGFVVGGKYNKSYDGVAGNAEGLVGIRIGKVTILGSAGTKSYGVGATIEF